MNIRQTNKGAFTLLELLVALAILASIVAIMGICFGESDRIWNAGMENTTVTMTGRSAIAAIVHDLQYAVADKRLTFIVRPDKNGLSSYGVKNDEICFVSLQHDPDDNAPRVARERYYWVRERGSSRIYDLISGFCGPSIFNDPYNHCYHNREWYNRRRPGGVAQGIVADNVACLKFFAPNNYDYAPNDYDSVLNDDFLPEYVDVLLELLPERAAQRAAAMEKACKGSSKELVDRNVRRFEARAFFHNRQGYMGE